MAGFISVNPFINTGEVTFGLLSQKATIARCGFRKSPLMLVECRLSKEEFLILWKLVQSFLAGCRSFLHPVEIRQ